MVALSIALAFLGILAFSAFVMWMRRERVSEAERLRARMEGFHDRALEQVAALRKSTEAALKSSAEVAREDFDYGESERKLLAERVGKLEMALQVRRVG